MISKEKAIEYLSGGIEEWIYDALFGTDITERTEAQFKYFDAIECGDLNAAKELENQLSGFQKIALKKLRGSGTKSAAQELRSLLVNSPSEIIDVKLKNIQKTLATYDRLIK